jgi:hypothetical protein
MICVLQADFWAVHCRMKDLKASAWSFLAQCAWLWPDREDLERKAWLRRSRDDCTIDDDKYTESSDRDKQKLERWPPWPEPALQCSFPMVLRNPLLLLIFKELLGTSSSFREWWVLTGNKVLYGLKKGYQLRRKSCGRYFSFIIITKECKLYKIEHAVVHLKYSGMQRSHLTSFLVLLLK